MTVVRRIVLASATALTAVLLVPAGPAHAGYPSTGTTYKVTVPTTADGFGGTVRIKIGVDKKKIAKFTAVITCPGKKKPIRQVWKNVRIYPGGTFASTKKDRSGYTFEARGSWSSKQGVSGQVSFLQNQCAPYGWLPYFAEK